MSDTKGQTQDKARKVGDSEVVEKGARLGIAALGLIHLLIGWIALRVAWGGGGGNADKSGALGTLADSTGGKILLWLAVAGFALLALWQLTEAIVGRHAEETKDRLKAAGKAVMYAFFMWSVLSFLRGAGNSDEKKTDSLTGQLMSAPGGRILVGIVGLVIIGVAGYHVWSGWTKHFLETMESHPGTFVQRSGQIGYIAKGIALATAGILFIGAALSKRASEAGGLDAALKELRDKPFGPYLLTVVALGIIAYGVYCFGRARHERL